MASPKLSPDVYATRVASALTRAGLSAGRAVALVQGAESAVRAGRAAGRAPGAVARGLLSPRGRRGHAAGQQTFESAAGGCAQVPIEAFMAGLDPLDLPPLPYCNVRKGSAVGTYGTPDTTDLDDTKQQAAFNAVFGKGVVTRAVLEEIYSGKNAAGDICKSKLVRVDSSVGKQDPRRNGASAIVRVRLKMKIGGTKYTGDVGRTFYRYGDGRIICHHDIFDLTSNTPKSLGSGIGESVTRSALRFYRKLGNVAGVTTHAAWVGRYVWASFGWNWNADSRAKILDHFFDYIDERDNVYELRGSSLLGEFESRSFREFKMYIQGLTTRAWNFASLHLYNKRTGAMEHVGKKYLAGVQLEDDPTDYVKGEEGAPEWEGALTLTDGHATYERAKARLKI